MHLGNFFLENLSKTLSENTRFENKKNELPYEVVF